MRLPVKFKARARKEGYRAEFLDTIAIPNEILEKIYEVFDAGQIRKFFGGYSKFRIDFPVYEKNESSATLKALLKVIFRGKVTRLSEKLEKEIAEIVGYRAEGEVEVNKDYILKLRDAFDGGYRKNEVFERFDGEGREALRGRSAEEYVFQEILVPEVERFGYKNRKDIIPQVLFSSFNGKKEDTRRIDFLISHDDRKLAIEVDDESHNREENRDDGRDEELKKFRIQTVRIKTRDLTEGKTEFLKKKIREIYKEYGSQEVNKREKEFLIGVKLAHLAQAILVKMAENGVDFRKENKIWFSEEMFMNLPEEKGRKIVEAAILDLIELDRNLAEIFQEKPEFSEVKVEEGGILVSQNGGGKIDVLFEEISFPEELINVQFSGGNVPKMMIKEENLRFLLQYIFLHQDFRENQIDGIIRGLQGEDSIVLLPTGSGKSLIYQFLGFLMPGATVVVEPLKSLMEDQVGNLRNFGIDAAVNVSGDVLKRQKKETYQLIREKAFFLIYVTPERVQMEDFRNLIHETKELGGSFPVCAIDEAHCVSEWGHDFRVSYLNLAETARKMLKRGKKKPVIIALTGTASDSVLKDMERDLKIGEECVIRPETFDRPEIRFRVKKVVSEQKMNELERILSEDIPREFDEEDRRGIMRLSGKNTKAGVVFCIYKSGRTDFGVDSVYMKLRRKGYGGVVKYYGTESEKEKISENASAFKGNRASLMIATKAFGMGIDKPNVRYTVHFGIPNSIEAYYQEAGRAGRDGEKAVSYIILSNDAPERNMELIDEVLAEDLEGELKRNGKKVRDDVNRLLFLHQKNYDKEETLLNLKKIFEKIGLEKGEKRLVAENGLELEKMEKVLFRLKILGVIEDYTIFDYANSEFKVQIPEFDAEKIVRAYGKYVSQYQEGQAKTEMVKLKKRKYAGKMDFVETAVRTLLEFVENVFEKSRRRAIGNILQIMEDASKAEDDDVQDEIIRRKILNHLGNTYADILKRILEDRTQISEAERAVVTVMKKDEAKLLAETRRTLQTYPEHPGLLLVSGVLGTIDDDTSPKVAANDIRMAILVAAEKYKISRKEMEKCAVRMIGETCRRNRDEDKYREFVQIFTREMDADFVEKILEVLPKEYTCVPAAKMLSDYNLVMISEIRSKIGMELWKKKN